MKTCRRRHEWQETFFTSVVGRGVEFDVEEEAWPNAGLAIHSSYEGALIDGLPADKVKETDIPSREIEPGNWNDGHE